MFGPKRVYSPRPANPVLPLGFNGKPSPESAIGVLFSLNFESLFNCVNNSVR